jgi:ElaB/YqjD/DUF883 family membrane-anchored ribosome-binding protein
MDERRPEGGRPGKGGLQPDPERSSAGRANTPMFDRNPSDSGQTLGAEGGRPPSHRELEQGKLGEGERMEGIAMPETQRALEETRDTVAREAAPIVAEKMQEALVETTEHLSDTLGDQAKKTADAVRHDVQRVASEKAAEVRDRVEKGVDRSLDRAADRLEGASRSLHETADRNLAGAGGVRGTAGRWAHEVADAGESAADYLRNTEVHEVTNSLERQVRERPLQTLLIAAAAGWLVGKILR